MAKNRSKNAPHHFLIITGLSGSGMSSATKAFEDLGYFCVDNLPLTMLSTFARLLIPNEEEHPAIEKAALVINIRERHFLSQFQSELAKLERKDLKPYIIFFEATDEILHRRFSETRRPHPSVGGKSLDRSIKAERKEMQALRKLADLIIDTSEHTVHTLRRSLMETFRTSKDGAPFRVQIVSYGHKFGNPRDLDLLFDVRHLPNPFFEPNLRELTGEDKRIVKFLDKYPEVAETISRFSDLLLFLLPYYRREGKSYVTVGIGCTGGRHRSVMVANSLKRVLTRHKYDVSVNHRDMQK